MKTFLNFIRLLFFTLLALLLTSTLISAIKNDGIFSFFRSCGFDKVDSRFFTDDPNYGVGDQSFTGGLGSIDIHWVSGSLNLTAYDGDEIKVHEESVKNRGIEDGLKLRSIYINENLTVRFSGEQNLIVASADNSPKALTVSIPKSIAQGLKNVTICGIDADITISGISAEVCEIESVTGVVTVSDSHIKRLSTETVSGNILVSAEVESISVSGIKAKVVCSGNETREASIKTVGGDVVFGIEDSCEKFTADSVSGSVTLNVGESVPFSAEISSVFGKLTSSPKGCIIVDEKKTSRGDGGCEIGVKTTLGDLEIN